MLFSCFNRHLATALRQESQDWETVANGRFSVLKVLLLTSAVRVGSIARSTWPRAAVVIRQAIRIQQERIVVG